ncbi:uncharacterized protein DS421_11g321240 [Arachis hypogaea]|uniref:Uncharacterized protein n=1 Tax=Arachis hypogaea TaxID=3818 RepID=A0A445AMR4_ARAHY|nr:uncharacterized protein DS421_11g321240 [Arachis hypogaea]RYR27723.1 hypothetical protein Ahy_B01g051761 [Arachis hypogaea]
MTTTPYNNNNNTNYYYYGPKQQEQVDEVPISQDKNFALHGKIVFLVLTTAFFLLIIFIIVIPRLRNRRGSSSRHESETEGDSTVAAPHNRGRDSSSTACETQDNNSTVCETRNGSSGAWRTYDDIMCNCDNGDLDDGINRHTMQRRAIAMRQREDNDDTAAVPPGIARQ